MRTTTNCLLMVLLGGVLAFAGCGKADKSTAQHIPATMDVAKLQQAFPSPTPGQQSTLGKVQQSVRYSLLPDALASLEKLASDPSLTEPQKKAVSDMIEGVKTALAKTLTAPAK
jgi:hypothetical protein